MTTESCPVCGTPAAVGDTDTFVTCSSCSVPFVPRAAARLALMVRNDFGPTPDGIELTEDFRSRYQLGRLLGVGAIGMVCEAVHKHSQRPVAVKFLKRIVDAGLKERFLQEGRLLARVQHQNVLKIFELSDLDGVPFLVTELMPGGTLKQRLTRDGKMAPAAAVALMAKCLDGLHACHAAGFIHRDLKPENILLSATDEPAIADLGIARVLAAHGDLTTPGAVMGTPRYMSPEQGRGEKVGIATDIYAMGAVLYEMLSGAPPFAAPDLAELIRKQIEEQPPPLAEREPDLPEGLADVVHRALAKAPSERPLSAVAFKDALLRTVHRRSVRTRRSGRAPRASGAASGSEPRPRERTRPTASVAVAIVGLALFAIAGGLAGTRIAPRVDPVPVRTGSAESAADGTWRELAARIDGLRARGGRVGELIARIRVAIEENRYPAMEAEVDAALAQTEADVARTRTLLADVDAALSPGRDGQDLMLERALTVHWLALARHRWLRQKKYTFAQAARRSAAADWEGLLSSGPEKATADMLPVLRRWHAAIQRLMRRPASMPSTAGPELAQVLADVHEVSGATYHLEWHPAAQKQLDLAAKAFLSNLGHLEGMTARLLERIVADLWRWGHADGAILAVASGMMFNEPREGTIEQLRALSSFLAPPARAAMRDLIERAQAGFRRR